MQPNYESEILYALFKSTMHTRKKKQSVCSFIALCLFFKAPNISPQGPSILKLMLLILNHGSLGSL